MSRKHFMIAVNWFGPYRTIEDARNVAYEYWWHGLYMAIGRKSEDVVRGIQYIGIGEEVYKRIKDDHHKMSLIVDEFEIWIGEVATAEPSGKRMKATRSTLDYAEWLHARFLKLPLNEKKTKSLPPLSVTVLNRWYDKDFETVASRPHSGWPDLIDYPGNSEPARTVWFGGGQGVFKHPGYAESESD